MTTEQLISHLGRLDVRLWIEGDRLRYSAPRGVLEPELRAELVRRKEEILGFLHVAREAVDSPAPSLEAVPRDQEPPLSFSQQRLWFVAELEPASPAYNLPDAARLRGRLDLAALEASFQEIVRRHEVLRTTFRVVDGEPLQVISPRLRLPLPVVDLKGLPAAVGEWESRRLAAEEAVRLFDLSAGPLIRLTLLRLGKEDHVLLVTMHHIVSDGWSMGIVIRELTALYRVLADGKPVRGDASGFGLPELPVQYADFAHWQRHWLRGEVLETLLAYWRRQLAGPPQVLELPCDRPRPAAMRTSHGAQIPIEVPTALLEALKQRSRERGSTLFMTVLAGFMTLLHRYTGQRDLAVGSPIANRNRAEIEGLVGFFVNTLVLRCEVSGDLSFAELLDRIREVALEAYAHQDLPFEKLVETLAPERDQSRPPLVQVMLGLQDASPEDVELPELVLSHLEVDRRSAMFDLTVILRQEPQQLAGYVEYAADLFDRATIVRLSGQWRVLLEAIAAEPEERISRLPLLAAAERHELLSEWNDTRSDFPRETSISQLFELQVERTPEAVAVVFGTAHDRDPDERLTYRELNRRANRLAHHLRSCGVGRDAGPPEVCVGLCVERSPEMVVAILGILKAGGAYVPLDPSYPSERLAFMLEDTATPVLVIRERLAQRLAIPPPTLSGLRLVSPEGDRPTLSHYSAENPSRAATAENLAYVTYTSGSTGRPKGVSVVHRGVVRLVRGTNYAELSAGEVFLQFAPISFDASTLEIWGALLNGGRLVVFPPHTPSLQELGRTLERHRVTTLWLTAGLFHQVVDENLTELGGVRQLLAGGDVLSARHVRSVLEALAGCTVINGYGPTESTTFTCCSPMRRPGEVDDSVSIGRPIANTRVEVLDRQLRPVGVGIFGELFIGGDGLARGYLNRPELTAVSFVPHPGADLPGERLYRSGDVVRWLPDGRIEFLGRRDAQVKLRGFRIELGEVEMVLASHPGVRQAVVILREEQLVAYAVPAVPDAELDAGGLRSFLGESLPDNMVPAAVVGLDALPLTPNGKVDRAALARRALPASGFVAGALASSRTEPRTPIEAALAAIWAGVLGLEGVGVHDDFFELGGHSLLATRVVSQVRRQLRAELELRTLFEQPTVAGLAGEVTAALRREEGLEAPPIRPVARRGPLPLSFAQERLWFIDRFEPDSALYNIPSVLHLQGRLDVGALARALAEIVRRHEMLRTSFGTEGGRPVERIRPAPALALPVLALDRPEEPHRRAEARRLALSEARRPFDLTRAPLLLRTLLLRLGPQAHSLVLTVHHIAFDGWSVGVFLSELVTLYKAFSTGSPSPLPELRVQYADFA
ncbi:MAG: amino acid adenylation domain-containing protein, partial [bacterium]|nr:amino acid adenylation domain-containing protein [bacterium]